MQSEKQDFLNNGENHAENNPQIQVPEASIEHMDNAPALRYERREVDAERTGNAAQVDASMFVTSIPQPITTPNDHMDDKTRIPVKTQSENPPIAEDSDLIEKEWVNRAKKVIKDTEGDPQRQGEEVGLLRGDYQEKRGLSHDI
jgi:hypothetical protein